MSVASSKPGSQRGHHYSKALHESRKDVSGNLSKNLREQYGIRSFPLRKGDEVKVVRGSFKGKTGKIKQVSYMNRKVVIDGIVRKKVSGQEVAVPFQPSNLMITELELTDKKRIASLDRKGKNKKKTPAKAEPVKKETKKGEK